MQIQINVLNVSKQTAQSKAGKSYQLVEVSFKDLSSGKVQSKKINMYSKEIYSLACDMQVGSTYSVQLEKEGDFWNWVAIDPAGGLAPPTKGAPAVQVKSTYETPEERAKKQLYIVKQSSISNAIDTLSPGAKGAIDVDKVLAVAQQYTDFVFGKGVQGLVDTPNDLPDSDIPF